jgi:peroxiredoxin
MAQITLTGNPIHTVGGLPALGTTAPVFWLVTEIDHEPNCDAALGAA